MTAEGTVNEGSQTGAPVDGGASDEMVTVSKKSLRKVQAWLRRAQGRYNNHDLKLSIMVISDLVDGGSANA